MAPAFPDQPIELTAELALGADLTADPTTWAWTPLGNDTVLGVPRLLADPITIQRGTAVGASSSQTTSATINVLNNDGWLTPNLASSPWWPYVDAGTPIRLRMRSRTTPYVTDVFARTVSNGWGTTSTGGYTWVPGTASQYNVGGSTATITFTAKADSTKAIRIPLLQADVDMVFDVSCNVVATGVANIVGPTLRDTAATSTYVWGHIEFGIGGAVSCHIREAVNGVFVTTVQTVVSGLTYTTGTVLSGRVQVAGRRCRMRAWLTSSSEPTTWALDVPVTTLAAGTALGIRSEVFAANTNTLPVIFTVDNISIGQPQLNRAEGYVADVTPAFNPQAGGSTWSTAQIVIGGIGSRLEKNDAPSYSPMRRSVQQAQVPPVQYWPLEDETAATVAASAFPGFPGMNVIGPAVFAFGQDVPVDVYQSRYGTKPMISVAAGAKLAVIFPRPLVQSQWAVSIIAQFYAPGIPMSDLRVLQWDTPGGTYVQWALMTGAAGIAGLKVRAYTDTGSFVDTANYTVLNFIGQATYTVEASQSGGNIAVSLFINDVLLATGSIAGTLTSPGKAVVNPDGINTTASTDPNGIKFIVGHLRVVDSIIVHDTPYAVVPETGEIVSAIDAWFNEPAHRRIERLCAEENVPFTLIGAPTAETMTALNAQSDGTFSKLVEQAAESESGGLLYEDGFGYAYLPRGQRYNQPAALTIDMSTYCLSGDTGADSILVPRLDARAANYWTITRTQGASGSYAAPAAYRARRGTIPESRTLDVLYDADTVQHASWRTHLGVDAAGTDYPSAPLDLAGNPGLIDAWLSCTIGSRVWRTNQPTIAGVGVIDQVIEGITETISPTSWQVTLTCSPGDVWNVAVYDDTSRRQDSASTTTNASYAAGVTTVVFKTVVRVDCWSTTATPYDCICLGERFTVTSMGSVSGTGPYLQTATVTRAVNGVAKTLTAAAEIHMHSDQLARFAL